MRQPFASLIGRISDEPRFEGVQKSFRHAGIACRDPRTSEKMCAESGKIMCFVTISIGLGIYNDFFDNIIYAGDIIEWLNFMGIDCITEIAPCQMPLDTVNLKSHG